MLFLSRVMSPLPSRGARRRRGRIAIAAAAAIVLAGGGLASVRYGAALGEAATVAGARLAAAAQVAGFVVADVSVEGRERASPQDILDAIGVHRGSAILAVDLAAAKARLEALPWVRRASVERRLPDMIFVHLVERRPLAFWQRQGKLVLIDETGAVVPVEHLDSFGPLVVLVGDDAPKLAGGLLDMLASEPALGPHVAAAVRVGGRRWNLHLDSGIDVALPEQDPESAWHRLAALDRSDKLLARNIEAVDLRLPDRLVVRLPPEPAKPASTKKPKPLGKPT